MRFQDLRYALRGLRRSPGFTLTAVLTLAMGIGANTAIFSVLNAVLLRPLPFHDASELVWGWGKTEGTDIAGIGPPPFVDYRAQNRTLEQLAAMEVFTSDVALTGEQQPDQVTEGVVSANFYDVLGLKPIVGRGFVEADEREHLPQVVILGRGFWQQHFSGSPSVIGKTLRVDGIAMTVAGVMPDIPLLMNVQIIVPVPMLNPGMNLRQSHFLRLIGRIKPGVTLVEAQADLDVIAHRLGEQYPDSDRGWSVRLQPLADKLVGPVKDALLLLLCAVGLVLLIACSNVANLLLVRATGRRKEVAIRAALGASRGRLLRQFLTESLLLALLGGAVALLLSSWGVAALRTWGPADLPRLDEIGVDRSVLGFALLISIITGILFGLVPALHATRDQVQTTLKGASQGGSRRSGGILVAAELAISLVLLISAGLSLKSLWRLVHVDPGFRTENNVTASVSFARNSNADAKKSIVLLGQMIERVATLPDVESAGAVSELPMTGTENDNLFRIEGKTYPRESGPGSRDVSIYQRVLGDYFQTMGTPLRQGRFFARQDTAASLPVVVINEPFARRFFRDQSPVGKRVFVDEEDGPVAREIVGVIGGARFYSLASPPVPEMYVPYSQDVARTMHLVVRTKGEIAGIGNALRGAVASVDPDEPISSVRTLEGIVSATAAQPHFYGFLLGLFAGTAVVLSAIGLYGVISYAVSRRAREIGIRLALGASARDILKLVAGQGVRPLVVGLVAGWAGAYFAVRLLASRLFEVKAHDTAVFTLVPVCLVMVAFAACWAPARRAMRIDPAASLGQE